MKPYPSLSKKDLAGVVDVVQFIARQREIDIRDWNNLQNIYVLGRKIDRIPSSSMDVEITDRIGDISFQDDYVYYLFNNAGTTEWRRVAAATW